MATPNINLTISVPRKRVYDLIITANETGAGYWARCIRETVPKDADVSWMTDPEDIKRWPQHGAALCGGTVVYGVLDDDTGKVGRKRYTLKAETVASGLALMSTKYPRHFADFMSENDDSITADVFLQCCLLGDVVYG